MQLVRGGFSEKYEKLRHRPRPGLEPSTERKSRIILLQNAPHELHRHRVIVLNPGIFRRTRRRQVPSLSRALPQFRRRRLPPQRIEPCSSGGGRVLGQPCGLRSLGRRGYLGNTHGIGDGGGEEDCPGTQFNRNNVGLSFAWKRLEIDSYFYLRRSQQVNGS